LEDESPHWQWRALAALLLAVFASDTTMLTQAAALADRLQEALYRFLIGQYRQAEGFERLQPRRQKAPPWSYFGGGRRRAAAGAVGERSPSGGGVEGLGRIVNGE